MYSRIIFTTSSGSPRSKLELSQADSFPSFLQKLFIDIASGYQNEHCLLLLLLPKLSVQISGRSAKVKGKKVWAVKFQLPLPLNHFSMYHSSVNFFSSSLK